MSEPGHIRTVAVEATALVRELCLSQGLEGPAQIGYAEAVLGSLLIASRHKSNESINMNAQGSARYRQALIDATPEGRVRGFLTERPDADGWTFGLSGQNGPWGSGVLSILYTQHESGRTPYTGMVAIETGYLDDAINTYFSDSEQLVSLVGLDVERVDGVLVRARGSLIQALGGAAADELAAIQSLSVKEARELAGLAAEPESFRNRCGQLLGEPLGGRNFEVIEETALEAFCTCSVERIERALTLTGEEDTLEALADDPVMTVTCDFCRREYKVSAERVKSLFLQDPSRLQ